MVADVAVADGAEDGVGQGVQAGVGVGMADQGLVMRRCSTPHSQTDVARAPAMGVEALADANGLARDRVSAMAKSSG